MLSYSNVIWVSDLNYRVSLSNEEVSIDLQTRKFLNSKFVLGPTLCK